MPLVQTVVQLKTLPFYDVPDVLIKPMSSKQYSTISREVFIFGLTFQLVREIAYPDNFLPGGRRDYTVQVQQRLCLAEISCPQKVTISTVYV